MEATWKSFLALKLVTYLGKFRLINGDQVKIDPSISKNFRCKKTDNISLESTGVNAARVNSIRLAEVWLDDYKKFFYAKTGKIKDEYGDISERVNLRKNLGCKSFQWYLDNIFPEMKPSSDLLAFGEVSCRN